MRHYKRKYDKEDTDKAIYIDLFIRLRDHGTKQVNEHLKMNHMKKYRDRIAEVDKWRAWIRS